MRIAKKTGWSGFRDLRRSDRPRPVTEILVSVSCTLGTDVFKTRMATGGRTQLLFIWRALTSADPLESPCFGIVKCKLNATDEKIVTGCNKHQGKEHSTSGFRSRLKNKTFMGESFHLINPAKWNFPSEHEQEPTEN